MWVVVPCGTYAWTDGRVFRSRMIAISILACLLAPGFLALCLSSTADAAVVEIPTATTTLTNTLAGQPGVTYTFGQYQEAANRRVVGVDITFPAGTNLTAATVLPTVGTWTRSGQTISITFATPISQLTPFSISIDNVTNRSSVGTFTDIQLGFRTTNNGGKQPQTHTLTAGSYTITPAPYISMTITTPDSGQSADFGSIDPGVTTGPKTVDIRVLSSAPYTITRTLADPSGAVAKLGLTSTWAPAGTLGTLRLAAPVTPAAFTDTFTLTPPWTTDPEQLLTASVTYTVVQ